MVVKNDPTLMFTNAGMNQFKNIFLGNTEPVSRRVADTQKCLRVSGKHNDLEEVGRDTYHHTMFEMLGNWSFGDYFKKEAILWAWELLTEVYKIDKERLYATVFSGYEPDGLGPDEEAAEIWKQVLPDDRIIPGDRKDNFWEMGDTGPCGPCSEIHIDLRNDEERAAVPGRELVNKGDSRVIELWNLVFTQFDRKSDGRLEPLPHKNVDTGMGFERLCMVLEGRKSNYDTDIFRTIINKIAELSGKEYDPEGRTGIAMRVISDHLRAICFSIADGQLPSNVKAGYVIRRILRRAVRYAYTFLNVEEPLLYRLVPTLTDLMGEQFPELKAQRTLIEKVIKEEEEAFLKTLDKGIKLMDNLTEANKESKLIPGYDAFVLYDTFGFPIDLTELIAKEKGYEVDLDGFRKELGKQKERSRNAGSKEESDWTELVPDGKSEFTGYDVDEEKGVRILKYRTVKNKSGKTYQIVLNRTPFYAESGGQTGDTGTLTGADGYKTEIINTIKENGLSIHIAKELPSDPEGNFTASINVERRKATASNHSATHLLDNALRSILGSHIEQKGSYVSPEYFRFDFSHYEKVDDKMLREVERKVNSLIMMNIPKIEKRDIPIEEARREGAIALFGEKYGDKVRMVRFGDSVELCAGTHVNATGEIGFFKIKSESAVAAGVRRIEAVTGIAAENYIYENEDLIKSIDELLNGTPNLLNGIRKIIEDNSSFKKKIEVFEKEKSANLEKELRGKAENINGINVIRFTGEVSPDIIKDVAFRLKNGNSNTVFAAGTISAGKPVLTLMYTDDLVEKGLHAGKDIRTAAKIIKGGGGGQPFFASAGGKDAGKLKEAVGLLVENATKQL
jgi:alanyl-tRNA synthetase